MSTSRAVPFVRIVHQPSSVYRMRYKKENRSTFLYAENAPQSQIQNQPTSSSPSTTTTTTTTTISSSTSISGSAPATSKKAVRKKGGGVSNDAPDGTFPKIEIVNGCGPATLIVSCVSKKEPYHVHPHKLIGNSCRSGVAILNIGEGETFFELSGISIEYTKQSEIEESINELKSKNVDPFNVGFGFDRKTIDQTQLRLCFQVYLRDSLNSTDIIRDKYHILEPVVSQIISNSSRKATLLIERTSKMVAPVDGNGEITIFVKRLEKDQKNLWVKFFDDSNWCESFKIPNIHYQSSMIIKPPAYKKNDIEKPHIVWFKLFVPFVSEDEKQKYMKKLKNDEENDEDESIENDEDNSENGENSTQLVVPDGKYESREIEFEYVPFVSHKRKLDTNLQLYDTNDHVDKEGHNEINEETRKKLKMRNLILQSNAVSQSNTLQTASISILPDDLLLNNSISEASCSQTSSINDILIDDKKLTNYINVQYQSEPIKNNIDSDLNVTNLNDEQMQSVNETNSQNNTDDINIDDFFDLDFSKYEFRLNE